jgi:hypothetical protein
LSTSVLAIVAHFKIISERSSGFHHAAVAMIRHPLPVGMIFCKSFSVDPVTNQTSLIGLFSSRHFDSFPTPPVTMAVFTYLTDADGEGELRLEIHRLSANEPPQWVWRQRRWIKFPDNPLLPIPVVFVAAKGLRFPVAGEYLVQLTLDGEVVTERILSVRQGV